MAYCKYTQQEIIDFYTADHTHPTKCVMWGQAITQKRNEVKNFIISTKPESILDYGSGKGFQYSEHKIHKNWTHGDYICPEPVCYDPGVPEFSEKPGVKFDSVLCFDVMEHIPEQEYEKVLKEIFNYARKSVCFNIAINPAKKSFPDGTNYHVLCRPEEWWFANIKRLKPKDLTVWLFFWSMKGVLILNAETSTLRIE